MRFLILLIASSLFFSCNFVTPTFSTCIKVYFLVNKNILGLLFQNKVYLQCIKCGIKELKSILLHFSWHDIWAIVEEDYQLPATLQGIPPNDLVKFENNSKTRNILISALGRKEYARITHLKTAHAIWKKLCDYNEATNEIKSMRLDTYTREYQMFRQRPGEFLDSVAARFDNIISNLRSCGILLSLITNLLDNCFMFLIIPYGV